MRRLPGALALFIVAVIVVPPTGCSVRSDEFLCEDAVAKLRSCCPSSSAPVYIDCHYYDSYCGGATYPQIEEGDARCIIGSGCNDLANGACGGYGQACP